jgi:hypothetical protein
VSSFDSVTLSFGHSTAFARSTWASFGTANLSVSKYCGSGQKRMVVPLFDLGTSPTTSSLDLSLPPEKLRLYSLPPRRTQHSRFRESALTTDTPTPCSPPAC